jgi:A/G-specific adenine glycosylase
VADTHGSAARPAVAQWANLGYPRRALWLHRAAVEIRDRHDGVVPREVEALLALTGIGDYTARAVAVFAYGERHRWSTRTPGASSRGPSTDAQPGPPARGDLAAMTALLPRDDQDAAIVNAAMMELGALVCTARAARCDVCPISALCAWRAAGYPDTGDLRRKQAAYEGSDRQARGAVLHALRAAPCMRRRRRRRLADSRAA